MDGFMHEAIRLSSGAHVVELRRGDALKLERATGATVRIVQGSAWLSTPGRPNHRMRAGELVRVVNGGTTLIYALEDAAVRVDGPEQCAFELRRRGEVVAEEHGPAGA